MLKGRTETDTWESSTISSRAKAFKMRSADTFYCLPAQLHPKSKILRHLFHPAGQLPETSTATICQSRVYNDVNAYMRNNDVLQSFNTINPAGLSSSWHHFIPQDATNIARSLSLCLMDVKGTFQSAWAVDIGLPLKSHLSSVRPFGKDDTFSNPPLRICFLLLHLHKPGIH